MSRVITRHMLRRRARARLDEIELVQQRVVREDDVASKMHLHRLGIDMYTLLDVEPAKRGPWRWYVAKKEAGHG